MKQLAFILGIATAAIATTVAGATTSIVAAAPTITSLSSSAAPKSGRFQLFGTGFGEARGASTVTVGGLVAPVVRWSDTLVTAYVPEAAPVGATQVRVKVDGVTSNAMPLTVEARVPAGRLQWRFRVEGEYVPHRPAVGPDGGVVVVSSSGDVYSLTADGGLKWVRPFEAGDGVPSIGADGTVYVASMNTITAIAPNGAIRWRFTEPSVGQGVIAGPTVGPDGNVYAFTDFGGLGALSLSPAGTLVWSTPGNPLFSEYGQLSVEVVFGLGQLYAAFDEFGVAPSTMFGITLGGTQRWATGLAGSDDMFMQRQRQPATGMDGSLYLTGMGGANGWSLYRIDPITGKVKWGFSPYPANGMSAPDVGPDGNVYFARSLSYLQSVTPTATSRWVFFDGSIIDYPIVSPDGGIVVAGSRPNFGQPGSVRGWNAATGKVSWQVGLTSENGGYQVLYSRPRFSKDSQTVYFGTAILASSSADQYSYLYALAAGGTAPPPPPPPPLPSPACTILGTEGPDILVGTSGSDVICGLGGADTLTGRGGDDVLRGGDGNDTLTPGPGADEAYGDAGDDLLKQQSVPDGPDLVSGGTGKDTVTYAGRVQGVRIDPNSVADDGGSAEADNVLPDVENFTGGAGGDTIVGTSLANVLKGVAGADWLFGLGGTDTLSGGDGDDRLDGGSERDTVDGGPGWDGCVRDPLDAIKNCET